MFLEEILGFKVMINLITHSILLINYMFSIGSYLWISSNERNDKACQETGQEQTKNMDDRPGSLWIHSLYGQQFQEDSPRDKFNKPYAASPIIPSNLCWLSCILCCLLAQTNFVLFIETGLYIHIICMFAMGL